ncbi:MAG: putative metal-binding motif-containing protein, partial [Candidatus Micrarchaeota archaeon]
MGNRKMGGNAFGSLKNLIASYHIYLLLIFAGILLSVSSGEVVPGDGGPDFALITCSPTPCASPSPSVIPSPSPETSPSPSPEASPSPSPEASPSPSASPTPDCWDYDLDGYSGNDDPSCGPFDCNDKIAEINPGATETCNGVDDDCDESTDEEIIPQACGTGGCAGTQECIRGEWGQCSSVGIDCGICGICDSQAFCSYDQTQNSDCSIYNHDEINQCDYVPDDIGVTRD